MLQDGETTDAVMSSGDSFSEDLKNETGFRVSPAAAVEHQYQHRPATLRGRVF